MIFECLKTSSYLKSILKCYLWAAFLLNLSLAQIKSAMFGAPLQTTNLHLILCGSSTEALKISQKVRLGLSNAIETL